MSTVITPSAAQKSGEPKGTPTENVIYLVAPDKIGVLPTDEANLMVTLAEDLEARRNTMTQQAAELEALLAFSRRLRDAMAAASSSAVRIALSQEEARITDFLLKQARVRVSLVDRTRYRHDCSVCGTSTLSNPEYEKLVAHKRKVDAATRGIGIAFATAGGAAPVVMANALFAFRTQKPDYHCPRCEALDTDASLVVFCPQCKAQNGRALLKTCPNCHYDYLSSVSTGDLWHLPEQITLPPAAGSLAGEFQLESGIGSLAFLPDGRALVGNLHAVQLWDLAEPANPCKVWETTLGYSEAGPRLSPTGDMVALPHSRKSKVRLLSARTGQEAQNFDAHSHVGVGATDWTFTPDGTGMICSLANRVERWSLHSGSKTVAKLGITTTATRVASSTDGTQVLAVGYPTTSDSRSTLFLLKGSDLRLIKKIPWTERITDVAWISPTMVAMATATQVQFVLMPEGHTTLTLPIPASLARMAVSPDGHHLAVASEHAAHVFDVESGDEVARVSRPDLVSAVAFAPDGRLAVCDSAGTLQFWAPSAP